MSIYNVNYLCREIMRDRGLRKLAKDNPDAALGRFDLTSQERDALKAGDVGTLYRIGVNSFLMGYLPRYEVFGLDMRSYSERMNAVRHIEADH